MALWVNSDSVELRSNDNESDLQVVIRSVYRQVLGNVHLDEGDRLVNAESMLRNGDITVRQFVEAVGQSDVYRRKFFESSSQYRFIELNCKHFLGRAPRDQAEIAEHVQRYNSEGYGADIASYVASDEYTQSFGDHTVPYARMTQTQQGMKNSAFNRAFSLFRGDATSDASGKARLISALGGNQATKITAPAQGSGATTSRGKRFRIDVVSPGKGDRFRRATASYVVSYAQLQDRMRNIQRQGGRIAGISEVA
jgi:phycoerythrin-associated linker protein